MFRLFIPSRAADADDVCSLIILVLLWMKVAVTQRRYAKLMDLTLTVSTVNSRGSNVKGRLVGV